MPYRLRFDRRLLQQMEALPGDVRSVARQQVKSLAEVPRPAGAKQLDAHPGYYRLWLPRGHRLVWPLRIQHAGNIEPEPSLRNARVTVTLDRLRIAAYPGGGTHCVLFDFSAQNQIPGTPEHLHFNATYRAREGEQVGVIGHPLFVGLSVGTEGLGFHCYTVNVKNDEDEAFLRFLDTGVFKAGLRLASAAQPAIAPLSGMALGLTRAIAARNRNAPVQDFYMGLDFSSVPTGARLAVGTYLAVQIPENLTRVWNWENWEYDPRNGQVVHRDHVTQLIPHNYVAFGVHRYEGA